MIYLIDKPEFLLFSSLQDMAEQLDSLLGHSVPGKGYTLRMKKDVDDIKLFYGNVREPLFSVSVIEENEKAYLAEVKDLCGILEKNPPEAYFETFIGVNHCEISPVKGPFPVIDGGLLYDRIDRQLTCAQNLRTLGLQGKTRAYEDVTLDCLVYKSDKGYERQAVSVSEIMDELSGRNSPASDRFNLFDAIQVSGQADVLPKDKRVCEHLCDEIEKHILSHEAYRHSPEYEYAFVGSDMKNAMAFEKDILNMSEGLRGMKYSKKHNGLFVGEAFGYDVVIRRRPEGEKYLAFVKDGQAQGFLNATRTLPGAENVVKSAYEAALRRDRIYKRYEAFKKAAGLGSGKKHGK